MILFDSEHLKIFNALSKLTLDENLYINEKFNNYHEVLNLNQSEVKSAYRLNNIASIKIQGAVIK